MEDFKEDRWCLLPFWILWILWKSRNEFMFSERNTQPIEEARRAIEASDEWFTNYRENNFNISRSIRSSAWEPPFQGWVKRNFDSSFHMDREDSGIGWIVRDHEGNYILSGSAKDGVMSGLKVINMELTRIINAQDQSIELGNLLFDIRHRMQKLPECSLGQVNREKTLE
ncbi:PREDICTED: uncharacterized protein LOC106330094 [Brassica oleracea var. oleracea]|uniref:uncharacterized protein LOC106330094 n=1 Tax=Brassica oleracea var. oleracea TaxID=109376 RepID=UPI0006A6C5CC|nr:PREDICTED: uncharacterized protein LOC106330094 [Brassica oleracea var. oleracea]